MSLREEGKTHSPIVRALRENFSARERDGTSRGDGKKKKRPRFVCREESGCAENGKNQHSVWLQEASVGLSEQENERDALRAGEPRESFRRRMTAEGKAVRTKVR